MKIIEVIGPVFMEMKPGVAAKILNQIGVLSTRAFQDTINDRV